MLAVLCSTTLAVVVGLIATVATVGPSDNAASGRSAALRHKASYRRPAAVPYPTDNPYSPAREDLGRTLFFEPRLSKSGSMSCATCHNPGLSWGDGERGVISSDAPFDRWVAGNDRAMPADALRGFVVFNEKGNCSTCHSGWRFSDDGFYDIGVTTNDEGRGKMTPFIELTRFAFKTPTLRNVAGRAPYLHNGSAATLEDVIDLYDRGGVAKRRSLSPSIKPLGLTASEKKDLVAFLRTLTSPESDARVPALPR